MTKTNNKGFSLVELIIVIAIMAILIGVLAPQYMRYVEKSRVSADKDLCDSVYNAMTAALADPDNASTAPGSGQSGNLAGLTAAPGYNNDVLSTLGVTAGTTIQGKLKSKAFSGQPINWALDSLGNVTITCSSTNPTQFPNIQIPE